ncbi:MAG TPA: hypothetical protein VEG32_09065, partial [Clostridia bacterium]|nr:hypothetical protein [Clostridia bacterium]
IDWGGNRVLTEQDLNRVAVCVTALPGSHQREEQSAYDYYIAGLTFLSLNDIHWQCETAVFGNFFECLKQMMKDAGDWEPNTSFQQSLLRFLDQMFPNMDERERIASLSARFEAKDLGGIAVKLEEATFMKLFCDAYFLRMAKQKSGQRQGSAAAGTPTS